MSPANAIMEEEVRRHALVDEEEVSNGCDSDADGNSAIHSFGEACLQAIEEQIGEREVEDVAKEERDTMLGALEDWSPPKKPDG